MQEANEINRSIIEIELKRHVVSCEEPIESAAAPMGRRRSH